MPSEDTPVKIRTSLEANNWWAKQMHKSVTDSLRVKSSNEEMPLQAVLASRDIHFSNRRHSHRNASSSILFTEKELSDLPFRKQTGPFFLSGNGGGSSTTTSHVFPNLQSSRVVERGILQRELIDMENQHALYKQNAKNNQHRLLQINKAMAVYMAKQYNSE